jgi:hypothetical protein
MSDVDDFSTDSHDRAETALREMLERATASEPPMGPMAQNALLAGIRRRRRRQAGAAAVCAAVVTAIAVTVPAVTGTHRTTAASGTSGGSGGLTDHATVFVSSVSAYPQARAAHNDRRRTRQPGDYTERENNLCHGIRQP